jgi:16S rRNA (guanine966-N2)-methyltransferase
MRIVGGQFRGRLLAGPAQDGVRPTSDRVRQAVFDILQHGIPDFQIEGTNVLDLFAGTGALGLEALSRGARFSLFVEDNPHARALIRANIEALGLTGVTKIFRRSALDLGPAGRSKGKFSLLFVDPPYGLGLGPAAIAAAAKGGWLDNGAVCVLEDRRDAGVLLPSGFKPIDSRIWGDTEVQFARFNCSSHDWK